MCLVDLVHGMEHEVLCGKSKVMLGDMRHFEYSRRQQFRLILLYTSLIYESQPQIKEAAAALLQLRNNYWRRGRNLRKAFKITAQHSADSLHFEAEVLLYR